MHLSLVSFPIYRWLLTACGTFVVLLLPKSTPHVTNQTQRLDKSSLHQKRSTKLQKYLGTHIAYVEWKQLKENLICHLKNWNTKSIDSLSGVAREWGGYVSRRQHQGSAKWIPKYPIVKAKQGIGRPRFRGAWCSGPASANMETPSTEYFRSTTVLLKIYSTLTVSPHAMAVQPQNSVVSFHTRLSHGLQTSRFVNPTLAWGGEARKHVSIPRAP